MWLGWWLNPGEGEEDSTDGKWGSHQNVPDMTEYV